MLAPISVVILLSFAGSIVLFRVWSEEGDNNNKTCARTYFGEPTKLYNETYGLSLLVEMDHLNTHESIGRVLDAEVMKNFFVVGCANRLEWTKTTKFAHTHKVLAFTSLCRLDVPFHELNMYFFSKSDPCLAPSSANCVLLLPETFVCSV